MARAGEKVHCTPRHAGHLFKTWKKRWFVLDSLVLEYYETDNRDQDEPSPTSLKLKGTIMLTDCVVASVPPNEAGSRPHAFQITPLSKKKFLICAENDAARMEWMAAIHRSVRARAIEHP